MLAHGWSGKRRVELTRLLACRETSRYRFLEWIYCHHAAVYATGYRRVYGFIP